MRVRLDAAAPAPLRARDRDRLCELPSALATIADARPVPADDAWPRSTRGAGSTDAPRRDLGELLG